VKGSETKRNNKKDEEYKLERLKRKLIDKHEVRRTDRRTTYCGI